MPKNSWIHKLIVPRMGGLLPCLSLILMTGCASTQKPIYLAPSFNQVSIQTITILPILDSRTELGTETEELEIQQIVNPVLKTTLKEKGYTVAFSSDFGGIQCLLTKDSTNLDPTCIRRLGPQNSTWVLVVFFKDFQRRKAFGSGVTVRMSGVLLDKSQDSVLWRDEAHAGAGRGGLVGMAMNSLLDKEVIQQCVRRLMSSLPHRKLHRVP